MFPGKPGDGVSFVGVDEGVVGSLLRLTLVTEHDGDKRIIAGLAEERAYVLAQVLA